MAVYFDHNATTPVHSDVLEAMLPYFSQRFGNPSAVYSAGRESRAAIDQARQQVASLAGAHPSQVIFTSGGTEANNLGIAGVVQGMGLTRVAYSAIEHASVREPCRRLIGQGVEVRSLAVDESGCMQPAALAEQLADFENALVCIMGANNETGVVHDVAALARQIKAVGGVFHCDMVQMAGKMPLDFARSGIDLMTLSSHKIYGPKGIGALIVDKRLDIFSQIIGGGQEKARRSGTENLPAIVGFGQAAENAAKCLNQRSKHCEALREQLERGLANMPNVVVFSQAAKRLPNTSFFSMAGLDGETLLMQLDQLDFQLASGSACSSKDPQPSHVLMAMGVDEAVARGAVRVSFGEANTASQVDQFLAALKQLSDASAHMAVMSHC